MGVSVSPAKFWSKAAKKATIAKAKGANTAGEGQLGAHLVSFS